MDFTPTGVQRMLEAKVYREIETGFLFIPEFLDGVAECTALHFKR